MTGGAGKLPGHAYVPGRSERHPDGAFDAIRRTAGAGMSAADLAASTAFRQGILFLEAGYFWEAHEVLEPVWMALPEGSAERHFVQCLIQLANGRLKLRMARPRAALRLAEIARRHLSACRGPEMMALTVRDVAQQIATLESAARNAV